MSYLDIVMRSCEIRFISIKTLSSTLQQAFCDIKADITVSCYDNKMSYHISIMSNTNSIEMSYLDITMSFYELIIPHSEIVMPLL